MFEPHQPQDQNDPAHIPLKTPKSNSKSRKVNVNMLSQKNLRMSSRMMRAMEPRSHEATEKLRFTQKEKHVKNKGSKGRQ